MIWNGTDAPVREIAQEALGLEEVEGWRLFVPPEHLLDGTEPYKARPQAVARVIKHLIDHGEIDWTKVAEPAPIADISGGQPG